jgi:hypothetical protein
LGGGGGDVFGISCISYLSATFAKSEERRGIERTNILVPFDRDAEMPVFIQRVIIIIIITITFVHVKICVRFQKNFPLTNLIKLPNEGTG